MSEALRLASEAQSIFQAAEANRPRADRRASDSTSRTSSTRARDAKTSKRRSGDARRPRSAPRTTHPPGSRRSFGQQGPGDMFVNTPGYKQIRHPDARSQTWSSGMVEVSSGGPALNMKGTLLETTAGGPGGGLNPPTTSRDHVEAVRAARRRRRVRQFPDHRQPGPLHQRGHRHVRSGRCGRGRHEAREHVELRRDPGAGQEDRDRAAGVRRDARRRAERSRPT